jgi:hypothetical protein
MNISHWVSLNTDLHVLHSVHRMFKADGLSLTPFKIFTLLEQCAVVLKIC